MVKEIDEKSLSVAEQAKQEVDQELRKVAVKELKDLYRKRAAAETILKNIDREIVDVEEAAEQGNFSG